MSSRVKVVRTSLTDAGLVTHRSAAADPTFPLGSVADPVNVYRPGPDGVNTPRPSASRATLTVFPPPVTVNVTPTTRTSSEAFTVTDTGVRTCALSPPG